MKRYMLLSLILFVASSALIAQSSLADANYITLKGTVIDDETGEPIPFANIIVTTNSGEQIGGATSDIDGRYTIKPLYVDSNSTFDLRVTYVGYGSKTINDIHSSQINKIFELRLKEIPMFFFCCCYDDLEYPQLTSPYNFSKGHNFTREDFEHLPIR